jgi:hypothetical protein
VFIDQALKGFVIGMVAQTFVGGGGKKKPERSYGLQLRVVLAPDSLIKQPAPRQNYIQLCPWHPGIPLHSFSFARYQ